jgi:hypothetical protein
MKNRVAWVLAAVATLVEMGVFRHFDFSPFNDQRFDRRAWLAVPQQIDTGLIQDNESPRGRMVQDILDHYLRPGMHRDQVVELLGRPDGNPKVFEQVPGTRTPAEALMYHLGYWSGFRLDLDALYIYLDEAGRVTGAGVVQY